MGVSEEQERGKENRKNILRNNGWKYPKFDEKHLSPRSSMNSPRHIIVKLLKAKDKERILNAEKRDSSYPRDQIFHQKP